MTSGARWGESAERVQAVDGGRRRWLRRARRLLLGLLVAAVLVAVGSALTVSQLEESDSFCVACHTAPEVEYYERAQATLAGEDGPDLASAHSGGVRCIDCHRGDDGVRHRVTTLALGARDALIFVAGRADPALEKAEAGTLVPDLLNAACAKCHAEALLVAGFDNHFHNHLPEAHAVWRAGGAPTTPPEDRPIDTNTPEPYQTTVSCVSCHRGHVTAEFGALTRYLDERGIVLPACGRCHAEVGRGPSAADLLGP